ncbi:ABC transporter permease [Roseovarius sp. SCSIO 43702]|uniref:ABC transporter permease n=1 Tax=Roseovarius sp. SCSIO 43702 TaxID=2823043 RepID=UPI001C73279C|nr:ABC transporter permease [Roseovarius sp. SCSIO 43702]QYX58188.1 ABC transporter permease [Roseovarius sp. SCSIO 43702]
MTRFVIRRLLLAIPTLLVIALVIFALLEAAPGDPMAQVPLTVSDAVRAEMRAALGLGDPPSLRFLLWLKQLLWVEPRIALDAAFGTDLAGDAPRILSWQSRAPVMEIVAERLPQTLWMVGLAYAVGLALALPIGAVSAWRQYSLLDHLGTGAMMLGYAIPPFFSGLLLILVFAVWLGWFPSVYDTTHQVTGLRSLGTQIWQMVLPVAVLSLQTTALLARYMRAAMLDEMGALYVQAARARGLPEVTVLTAHAARNALVPVVTIAALGLPQVFGGAVITEQIFRVNGIGQLLISALQAADWPVVRTVTFLMAALIVLFNILADLLHGWLDPRVRP